MDGAPFSIQVASATRSAPDKCEIHTPDSFPEDWTESVQTSLPNPVQTSLEQLSPYTSSDPFQIDQDAPYDPSGFRDNIAQLTAQGQSGSCAQTAMMIAMSMCAPERLIVILRSMYENGGFAGTNQLVVVRRRQDTTQGIKTKTFNGNFVPEWSRIYYLWIWTFYSWLVGTKWASDDDWGVSPQSPPSGVKEVEYIIMLTEMLNYKCHVIRVDLNASEDYKFAHKGELHFYESRDWSGTLRAQSYGYKSFTFKTMDGALAFTQKAFEDSSSKPAFIGRGSNDFFSHLNTRFSQDRNGNSISPYFVEDYRYETVSKITEVEGQNHAVAFCNPWRRPLDDEENEIFNRVVLEFFGYSSLNTFLVNDSFVISMGKWHIVATPEYIIDNDDQYVND